MTPLGKDKLQFVFASTSCELCDPPERKVPPWQRLLLAVFGILVIELMLWSSRAHMLPWLYALNAATVAVMFAVLAFKLDDITPNGLRRPRRLVDTSDRQTAATLAAQFSAESHHSLLAWTALLATLHSAVFALATKASSSLGDRLGLLAMAFGVLALLCHLARVRIAATNELARTAFHVIVHQPGIGRFARDVYPSPDSGWGIGLVTSILNGLSWVWAALGFSFFATDLLQPFL